jgi:hypothetical protein
MGNHFFTCFRFWAVASLSAFAVPCSAYVVKKEYHVDTSLGVNAYHFDILTDYESHRKESSGEYGHFDWWNYNSYYGEPLPEVYNVLIYQETDAWYSGAGGSEGFARSLQRGFMTLNLFGVKEESSTGSGRAISEVQFVSDWTPLANDMNSHGFVVDQIVEEFIVKTPTVAVGTTFYQPGSELLKLFGDSIVAYDNYDDRNEISDPLATDTFRFLRPGFAMEAFNWSEENISFENSIGFTFTPGNIMLRVDTSQDDIDAIIQNSVVDRVNPSTSDFDAFNYQDRVDNILTGPDDKLPLDPWATFARTLWRFGEGKDWNDPSKHAYSKGFTEIYDFGSGPNRRINAKARFKREGVLFYVTTKIAETEKSYLEYKGVSGTAAVLKASVYKDKFHQKYLGEFAGTRDPIDFQLGRPGDEHPDGGQFETELLIPDTFDTNDLMLVDGTINNFGLSENENYPGENRTGRYRWGSGRVDLPEIRASEDMYRLGHIIRNTDSEGISIPLDEQDLYYKTPGAGMEYIKQLTYRAADGRTVSRMVGPFAEEDIEEWASVYVDNRSLYNLNSSDFENGGDWFIKRRNARNNFNPDHSIQFAAGDEMRMKYCFWYPLSYSLNDFLLNLRTESGHMPFVRPESVAPVFQAHWDHYELDTTEINLGSIVVQIPDPENPGEYLQIGNNGESKIEGGVTESEGEAAMDMPLDWLPGDTFNAEVRYSDGDAGKFNPSEGEVEIVVLPNVPLKVELKTESALSDGASEGILSTDLADLEWGLEISVNESSADAKHPKDGTTRVYPWGDETTIGEDNPVTAGPKRWFEVLPPGSEDWIKVETYTVLFDPSESEYKTDPKSKASDGYVSGQTPWNRAETKDILGPVEDEQGYLESGTYQVRAAIIPIAYFDNASSGENRNKRNMKTVKHSGETIYSEPVEFNVRAITPPEFGTLGAPHESIAHSGEVDLLGNGVGVGFSHDPEIPWQSSALTEEVTGTVVIRDMDEDLNSIQVKGPTGGWRSLSVPAGIADWTVLAFTIPNNAAAATGNKNVSVKLSDAEGNTVTGRASYTTYGPESLKVRRYRARQVPPDREIGIGLPPDVHISEEGEVRLNPSIYHSPSEYVYADYIWTEDAKLKERSDLSAKLGLGSLEIHTSAPGQISVSSPAEGLGTSDNLKYHWFQKSGVLTEFGHVHSDISDYTAATPDEFLELEFAQGDGYWISGGEVQPPDNPGWTEVDITPDEDDPNLKAVVK